MGLDGRWKSEDGQYLIRTVGSRVYWLGFGKFGSRTWAHVFCGTLEGSSIRGDWGDIPLGEDHFTGTLSLRVDADTMECTSETGGFGCRRWERVDFTTAVDMFDAAPGYWGDELFTGVYDNDVVDKGSATGIYFMSQWGDRVFMFGKSKGLLQYANVGFGRVDGHTLIVEWCDLPISESSDNFYGKELVLELNEPSETLTRVSDDSNIFGGILWKKRCNKDFSDAARWMQRGTSLTSSLGKNFQSAIHAASLDKAGDAKVLHLLKQYNCAIDYESNVKTYGADGVFVYLYTLASFFYQHLNRNLRNDAVVLPAWSDYIVRFHRALQELPSYIGVAYRGIILQAGAELYTEGKHFSWAGFTSVSQSREVAMQFVQGSDHGYIFEISIAEPNLAFQIESLSAFPEEKEVLLSANASFIVRHSPLPGDRVIRIELVAETTKAHYELLDCRRANTRNKTSASVVSLSDIAPCSYF